jgi:hypothetical protein
LNLAQAVLLVAHDVFTASGARRVTATRERGRVLDAAWRGVLIDELVTALENFGSSTIGPSVPIAKASRAC